MGERNRIRASRKVSDEPNNKAGKVWLYSLGLIVALPLLYVLSVGPAAVLIFRGFAPKSVESGLETLYMPLKPFAQATNTEGLFQIYVEAWLKVTGTSFPSMK